MATLLCLGTNTIPAHALDSDFSDGITVDSTLDTTDTNIGDGICDDGGGNCTLRAAIQEANSNVDVSSITFNINETADFTNNSQAGYTITPTSQLPDITTQLTIDGYTQPGAQANTAISPNPFNGTLLIEIDGSQAGAGVRGFSINSNSSVLRGLVINSFAVDGIDVAANDIVIQGNYIGTDPTGLIDKGNGGMGVAQAADDSNGLLAGGLDPEDRNIISGNDSGGLSPNTSSDNWVIQGNYFGLNALGVGAIPNSSIGGSGALSLDNSSGHLVGGPQTGAKNVISGNNSMGIAPHNAPDLTIQGNFFGTDYTGNNPLPNVSTGISITGASTNVLVGGTQLGEGNIIRNSAESGGIFIDETSEVSILGNSIYNNSYIGIQIGSAGINDDLDQDAGPNDLLNFPVYTSITEVSGDTIVDYYLDVPAGDYRIEFYSNTVPDGSGYGEGEVLVGYQNITSSGTGRQTFSHTLGSLTGLSNLALTTTEIDNSVDGFGPTSQFGGSETPIDVSVSKTITGPQNIERGGNITYQLKLTQNGTAGFDLSQLDGSGPSPLATNVFIDLAPPDLTFLGSTNTDLNCVDTGSAFIAFVSANHPDWHAIFCSYVGSGQILTAGQSISTELTFEVAGDSDLSFTNLATTAQVGSDPDSAPIGSAALAAFLGGGNPDFIDYLLANPGDNVAAATYPIPAQDGGTNNSTPSPSLSASGTAVTTVAGTASLVVLMTSFVYTKARRLRI